MNRVKVVSYDDESLDISCPICKKTVMKNVQEGKIKPCKHLKLWHNNICDGVVYTTKEFKSVEESISERSFIKLAKKHKMIILKYKGGYLGGCQYPVDVIAFKK